MKHFGPQCLQALFFFGRALFVHDQVQEETEEVVGRFQLEQFGRAAFLLVHLQVCLEEFLVQAHLFEVVPPFLLVKWNDEIQLARGQVSGLAQSLQELVHGFGRVARFESQHRNLIKAIVRGRHEAEELAGCFPVHALDGLADDSSCCAHLAGELPFGHHDAQVVIAHEVSQAAIFAEKLTKEVPFVWDERAVKQRDQRGLAAAVAQPKHTVLRFAGFGIA